MRLKRFLGIASLCATCNQETSLFGPWESAVGHYRIIHRPSRRANVAKITAKRLPRRYGAWFKLPLNHWRILYYYFFQLTSTEGIAAALIFIILPSAEVWITNAVDHSILRWPVAVGLRLRDLTASWESIHPSFACGRVCAPLLFFTHDSQAQARC